MGKNDSKKFVYAALWDPSEVFDTQYQEILVTKTNILVFKKRIQRVLVRGVTSYWIKVKIGVLGPLLFNFYISDIEKPIPEGCNLIQYAEDCMMQASSISSSGTLSHLQFFSHELNFFR